MSHSLPAWGGRLNGPPRAITTKREMKRIKERHEGPAPTSLWVLPGEGHAWPGVRAWSKAADKPAADLDASALILDFFLGGAP